MTHSLCSVSFCCSSSFSLPHSLALSLSLPPLQQPPPPFGLVFLQDIPRLKSLHPFSLLPFCKHMASRCVLLLPRLSSRLTPLTWMCILLSSINVYEVGVSAGTAIKFHLTITAQASVMVLCTVWCIVYKVNKHFLSRSVAITLYIKACSCSTGNTVRVKLGSHSDACVNKLGVRLYRMQMMTSS